MKIDTLTVKPFIKWVGGKTQLLDNLEARLPAKIIQTGTIERYIEPFVGGGALFFYLASKYKIKKSYLIDNNEDLILTYKVIQEAHKDVMRELVVLEARYLQKDDTGRTEYYYDMRDKFNKQKNRINYQDFSNQWIRRAAYLIFLNKTCFNGLFRSNSKGEFNVPHGRYKNPKICDAENIGTASSVLKNTKLICGDFSECRQYIIKDTLVYFDPPYRPLNTTSSFTAYTKDGFCDNEQVRLAMLCKELSQKGSYILLSNSDPKNENPKDNFFDELYTDFQIDRIFAKRLINCDATKRGNVHELVISNCVGKR